MKRPFSPGWTVSGMKLVPCNQPPSESDATGPDQLFEEKSKNFSRPALLGGCAHVVETIYLCWFFPRGYHTSLYSNNVAVFWLHDQVWSSLMLVCFLQGLFIAYTKKMNRTHDPNDCRKAKETFESPLWIQIPAAESYQHCENKRHFINQTEYAQRKDMTGCKTRQCRIDPALMSGRSRLHHSSNGNGCSPPLLAEWHLSCAWIYVFPRITL